MTDLNLDRLEELAEAATEGPWEAYRPHAAYRVYELCSTTPQGLNETLAEVSGHNASADAEFIAAARSSVPMLLAAVEAALSEHWSEPYAQGPDYCAGCEHRWPCDTYRAIEAALGGEGE